MDGDLLWGRNHIADTLIHSVRLRICPFGSIIDEHSKSVGGSGTTLQGRDEGKIRIAVR